MPDVFLKRQDSAEEYLLTDRTSLGRYYENDIELNDDAISRHHCVFYLDGSDYVVKDLDSSNGTFLNDQPIHESKIAEGDRLKIGLIEFIVIVKHQDVDRTQQDPRFNSIIFDRYFRNKITGIHVKPKQAPFTDYFFECNSVSTVGRMSICNIPINSNFASRNNTTIDVREHRVMIADMSSTNGTFVNGDRIINSELLDGDTFSVAGAFDFDITFEYDQSNSLGSIAKIGDLHTIDIVADAEKILELYDTLYGNQVLLEVERQTHVFCNEVETLLAVDPHRGLSKQTISKFLHGISKAEQVESEDSLQKINQRTLRKKTISPDLIQKLAEISRQPLTSGMVYFESGYEESKERTQINGLIIRFADGFQLVLFGLPIENILYMIYAAGWLGRIRLNQ